MKSGNFLPIWLVRSLILPLVVLNGWLLLLIFEYFQSLIAVLITALLLAFVLEYPVNLLQRLGVKRHRAVLWVFAAALSLLVVLALTLAPVVVGQLSELANRLPSWIDSGTQQLLAFHTWAADRRIPIDLRGLTTQLTDRLSTQLQTLTGQILAFVLSVVSRVLDMLLTVVLTFYLMLQGDRLWDGIFEWFPKQGRWVRYSLRQHFQNYFAGQATLAALMGFSMTVAFLVLQVPFGLLFGLAVGVMTLIPFGGALSIVLITLLVALKDFWLGVKVLLIATLIEQAIENAIAPRLLGGFTGLNPVWVLVSLLLGLKLGGVIGLLVAVPMASFVKSTTERLRRSRFQSESIP